MDARAKTVREILHSGDQFLIPFFQRHYSWRRRDWQRLWSDLETLMEDDKPDSQHFLGPLVCTPAGHVPGEVPAYQLIDGQQRLTTLTLLLAAIRDVAREHGLTDLAEEIVEDYLIHKRKKALQRYKVVPRIGDREVLIAVIEGKIEKQHRKAGVTRSWQFYRRLVSDWATEQAEQRLRELFVAVTERLSLVIITIDGENPYEIFESLNSTGLPLEESDLIRNFLFMHVPIDRQDEFHNQHWASFESMFEETDDDPPIPQTQFYRTYLMREGRYSKAKFTFVDFKEQSRERGLSPESQVDELKRFARYELMLRRPHKCEDPDIGRALAEIGTLEITTAHPLLMTLLDRFESETLAKETLLGCIQDLASFVLRRSVCGESTRSYGRWFCEAVTEIKDDPREDLRKYWLRRGWPDNETFVQRVVEFPLYRREPRKCRLILERLEESYGHKEKVDTSTLSIEHVMPQTVNKGKSAQAWKQMIGDNWQAVHEKWLHTLGNLTLSGYNPDLGNKAYSEKRAELSKSNLVLNRHFADVETWNEPAIRHRGQQLAHEVAKLWPRPPGRYEPPPEEDEVSQSEKRQAYLEYWRGFVEFAATVTDMPKLPKPARRDRLRFPIGKSGIRLLALANLEGHYVGVAISCYGPKGLERFSVLQSQAQEIEREVGEKLLWQKLVQGSASHIALRLPNADPQDDADRRRQYEWLIAKLKLFNKVFSHRCKMLDKDENAVEKRQLRRHRFWEQLLERAGPRTSLHSGVSPGHEGWIATGAGKAGLAYIYVIGKNWSRVELYIDRGKGKKNENKRIFDELYAHKTTIEQAFGGSLHWERLDGKRACRVSYGIDTGGYRAAENQWPTIQDAMIDAMIRLEQAFGPQIAHVGQSE
ncbi:MAG: hypothetical protein KatS3mg082_2015 [Nitrospiraceae bacterium]|nr:MAG: hypothetical protein KatS3mg082_2015 [Nitrospiraceae bacterium]